MGMTENDFKGEFEKTYAIRSQLSSGSRQIEDEEKRALRAERTCSIPDPGHVSEKF